MIRLNRTSEYGLMALSHMRTKTGTVVTSTREVAEAYGLPFEILAKTLQKLKENKFITSVHGTKGGYVLNCNLASVTLDRYMGAMEGDTDVVCCCAKAGVQPSQAACPYVERCNIKPAMQTLNDKLSSFMQTITLDELTQVGQRAL